MNLENVIIMAKEVDTHQPIGISIDDITEDRALIQANSRGGKSYFVRKLCEKAFGKVQIILIDPEGEYSTLREKFDFLLVGNKADGADIQVSVKIAELLANKLLESGVSTIIDLSELLTPDKVKFVRYFDDKLANEPNKKLWHNLWVIHDECHMFAPEKGQGEAESLNAVMALASKGGKRGYALIAATQRPAKLSKNVTNELNTKFIGRAGGYDDIQRAKQELGLPKSTPDSMFRIKHEFYALGPGVQTEDVIRIKADPVETTHKTNASNWQKQKTPTPDKIRGQLGMFEDLPEEAEKEAKTKEDLQRIILELKRENQSLKMSKPVINPLELTKAEVKGRQNMRDEILPRLKKADVLLLELQNKFKKIGNIGVELSNISDIIEDIQEHRDSLLAIEPATLLTKPTGPKVIEFEAYGKTREVILVNTTQQTGTNGLTGPERKILNALASYPHQRATNSQVAVLARYSPNGSAYTNPRGHLRALGYINYENEMIVITKEGLEALGEYEPISLEDMQKEWLSKLTGPENKILKPLIEAYPNSLTKEDLAEKSGYSPNGSAFTNPLGHLRSIGLIEYVRAGEVKATAELCPTVVV